MEKEAGKYLILILTIGFLFITSSTKLSSQEKDSKIIINILGIKRCSLFPIKAPPEIMRLIEADKKK